MKNSLFPSVREAVLVIVITAFFLILTAVCIGLRPEHFLMAGIFWVLFFAGQTTRKLAVALLPFFIFGISYDWMRVYPNYQVNPIDVKGLYEAEKSLSGLSVDGLSLSLVGILLSLIVLLPISLPGYSISVGYRFPLHSGCGSI